MYFIPIIVPIFVEGDRRLIHSDWKRALELLRDSFDGRYGRVVVAAPWLPADHAEGREQELVGFSPEDDIELVPIYDGRTRARAFWTRELRRVRAQLEPLVAEADVVHSGLGELYRPLMELPLISAVRRGIPTVFVQDTDTVLQMREEPPAPTLRGRLQADVYCRLYEQVCRTSVAHSDLSLLKGKDLIRRYGKYAKNAREFHNTSYLSNEVVAEADIERRLTTLGESRPLRFVYCGRLIERKGVDDSVRIVEEARKLGANVAFDIIGQGPCESALAAQIEKAGLRDRVRLLGVRSYDQALLRDLAGYDAILFSPPIEDTPRMIFDGFAAGLPLLGTDIAYVRERAEEDGGTLLLPRGDVPEAARRIAALDRDRRALIPLTRAAVQAGRNHAADIWYKRRAEWTIEAVNKARPTHRTGPGELVSVRPKA